MAGDGAFASVNEDIDTVEPVLDIEMMDGFPVSPRSVLAISQITEQHGTSGDWK